VTINPPFAHSHLAVTILDCVVMSVYAIDTLIICSICFLRTVVFRGFVDQSDSLYIVTDSRSKKVCALAFRMKVNSCFGFRVDTPVPRIGVLRSNPQMNY
jgi:hypothetical protein